MGAATPPLRRVPVHEATVAAAKLFVVVASIVKFVAFEPVLGISIPAYNDAFAGIAPIFVATSGTAATAEIEGNCRAAIATNKLSDERSALRMIEFLSLGRP